MSESTAEAHLVDSLELGQSPSMQIVQDTGDDLDSDDASTFSEESVAPVVETAAAPTAAPVPAPVPAPVAAPVAASYPASVPPTPVPAPEPVASDKPVFRPRASSATRDQQPRQTRTTRGMSLLPVRQANEPSRSSGSPPHTPVPLKSLNVFGESKTPTSAGGPGSDNQATNFNPHQTTPVRNPKLSSRTPMADNDQLLSTYITQLAAKEARVGDLRTNIAMLQQELTEAESELTEFKENGRKLAEIVHGGGQEALKRRIPLQKGSTAGGPGLGPHGEHQKDMIGIGKRVVDEIGTQFWSFLEDVKSATMGNVEFEHQREYRQQPNYHHNYNQNRQSVSPNRQDRGPNALEPEPPVLPARPGSRSPSPQRRQLNPKRSIQNFLKNRSPSPIRNPLSPQRSPRRQELAEHHASQRQRESERLTKKLSQLDLRAPQRAASD